MKRSVVLLVCYFFIGMLFGQSSDWKQLENQPGSNPSIYYQTSSNQLITRQACTNEYFILRDLNTENWEQLSFPIDIQQFAIPFREDNNGKLYFFFKNIIYVNEGNTFKQFTFQFQSESILDICFLSNNNLLLVTQNRLELYSSLGKIIKSASVKINSGYFLTAKNNTKNFLVWSESGSSCSISELSNDLSSVGNTYPVPSCNSIFRIENRLFYDNTYSDDGGKTWLQYKKNENCACSSSPGCNAINLYSGFYNWIKVYSASTLDTPKTIVTPFKNINILSARNCIYLVQVNDCNNEQIYFSNDNAVSWKKIKEAPRKCSNSYLIAAGTNESIVSVHCANNLKKENSNVWTKDTNYIYRKLISLSNNSFYNYNINGVGFLSLDNGQSWEKSNTYISSTSYYNVMEERNKKLLIATDNELLVSTNSGKNFQRKLINNKEFRYKALTFESDTVAYFVPDVLFSQENFIRKINFSTEKITEINYKIVLVNQLKTSFDGKVLYALKQFGKDIELYTSFDMGDSFEQNTFPAYDQSWQIQTDHLGHVYLYSSKLVFISSDFGKTWRDISPIGLNIIKINDLQVSFDNYLYLATYGSGVIKYKLQLSPTSTQEISTSPLQAYPNPTTGTIRIEGVEIGEKSQVRVTDILGREVLSTQLITNELNLNPYPSGVYYLQVIADDKKYIGKVVKE